MAADPTRVWAGDMSAAYDECLVPVVFRPYADDLVARIAALSPRRVLELAAGTGVVTATLARALPDAEIVATDLNTAMVEIGAARAPEATWRQADAMNLPFDAESFDCVVCQFGVMFLPDRPAAYSGIRHVLADGGSFVFNAWGPLADHEIEATVIDALAATFPADPPTFLADVPHGYCDADQIRRDLLAAGLECLGVEMVELTATAESAAQLARGYCRGTPLRAQIEARGDLEQTTSALEDALRARFGSGRINARMTALVSTARRTES
jgi:SAM-dependent methyltransferase